MNSKKLALLGLLILLVGANIGFYLGRFTAPTNIVEKVNVVKVEVEKERIEWRERVVVEKVYLKDEKQKIHREEKEVIHPNGLVEKTKTEDINTEIVVKQDQIKYVDREVLKVVENYRVEEKQVEKQVRIDPPSWNAAIMVGASIHHDFMPTPYVVGVHVQKRILGPVMVGGFLLTNKTGGLSLGGQW